MINKVILLGNIGKDPETRDIGNGSKVSNFTLATSKSWKDKTSGEKKTETQWHNIVAWRHLADITEKFLKKGSKIYIEGEITQRSWDKDDGTKGYITEIVASNIMMLDTKSESTQQTQAAPPPASPPADEDDLPF